MQTWQERSSHMSGAAGVIVAVIAALASPAFAQRHAIGSTSFEIPAGWQVQPDTADHATLVHQGSGHYLIAVVSVPRPTSTGPVASFASEWKRITSATPTASVPAATRRTLGKRTVYEGAMAVTNDGQAVHAHLIMLDLGSQVVSVLIYTQDAKMLAAYRRQLDWLMSNIQVAASPPPAQPAPAPQARPAPGAPRMLTTITLADLVGTWRTGAGASTDFYNSTTGNYSGSVTGVYGETLTIKANGAYAKGFSGMVNGHVLKSSSSGTVSLSGGFVVFSDGKAVRNMRLIDYAIAPDGTVRVRLLDGHYDLTKGNVDFYAEAYVRAPVQSKAK